MSTNVKNLGAAPLPALTRRRALVLGGGVVVGGVLTGGLRTARADTAAGEVSLGPATVLHRDAATPAAPAAPYRPVRVDQPAELANFPAGARTRWWDPSWTSLQQGFAACAADEVLVLPERSAPYLVDAARGFPRGGAMAVMKRGLVGLGPGVVVRTSETRWSNGAQTSALPVESVLASSTDGAYLGNLEMQGRDLGGFAYNGVRLFGNGAVVENVYFNAAHRGFKNAPPGETGAVNNWRGSDQLVVNCEIECRDAAGRRVASSPLMFNRQERVRVVDVYAHHSVAGMPTFWSVTDASTVRLRSEHNGSGSGGLNGSAINHELCRGTITHTDATLLIDYRAPVNSGLHLSVGTDGPSAVIRLFNPTFDRGPWEGALSVQYMSGGYRPFTQRDSDISAVSAQGRAVPVRISR